MVSQFRNAASQLRNSNAIASFAVSYSNLMIKIIQEVL
jgi:hypothetical protein